MKRNPKILLINPPSNCVDDDRVEPPLGLLYIASTLREKYKDVSLYDMTGCKSDLEINDKIRSVPNADIYGISCFSTNYPYVKQIIENVKKNYPDAYVVLGGPHPTGLPDFTFSDSKADAVVVGEGEDIFRECVNKFVLGSRLTGVLLGKGRDNIDSYSFPSRDLVDFSTYSRKLMGHPVISLLSSRGCRHNCVHCNSVVMGGGNRNVRYRSPDNIIEEIKSLRDRFSYFRFNDDHFTGNPDLEELLIKMRDLDIIFRIFARVEDLDEKTCQLLKEAGCIHVAIGLESLNPDNLRVLGRVFQIGKEQNIKIAQANDLVVRASFIVGLPYDSDETIFKYFKKAGKLGIDEFAIYPLIPYPGTRIWKNPGAFGYTIVNFDFIDYVQMGKDGRTCYALKHKNFSPDDVRRWLGTASRLIKNSGVKHMRESVVAK